MLCPHLHLSYHKNVVMYERPNVVFFFTWFREFKYCMVMNILSFPALLVFDMLYLFYFPLFCSF